MRIGRTGVAWRHGIVMWCEFGDDRERARRRLAANMERVYKLPREAFEKWSPAGTPEAIAEFCAPYLETGITDLTLITHGEDPLAFDRGGGRGQAPRRVGEGGMRRTLFEDEHDDFRDAVRAFIAAEATPHVHTWRKAWCRASSGARPRRRA